MKSISRIILILSFVILSQYLFAGISLNGIVSDGMTIENTAKEYGLIFPSNGESSGDIRIVWDGSNLLSRTTHTAIWKIRYTSQNGYYAVTWHGYHDGSWHGSKYEFGGHPYPCDGTYEVDGQASNGTGGSGTSQYMELAGIGAADYIAIPMEPAFLINNGSPGSPAVDGTWLVQARTCEVISGTTLRHKVYPDIENNPSDYIQVEEPLTNLESPSDPAFYFGASDWTASGSANSECVSGTIRGLRLFDVALSQSEIEEEAAAIGNNTAASTTGQANTWYINDNPKPTDITDKSGEGHNPSWDNANRPTLYEN